MDTVRWPRLAAFLTACASGDGSRRSTFGAKSCSAVQRRCPGSFFGVATDCTRTISLVKGATKTPGSAAFGHAVDEALPQHAGLD
jgi:hypothetical protein